MEEIKKVAIVSFRIQETPTSDHFDFRKTRRKELARVFEEIKGKKASHALFPGWTFVYSKQEVHKKTYKNEIKYLEDKSRELSISIFAELCETRGNNKNNKFRPPPEGLGLIVFDKGKSNFKVRQKFATASSEKNEEVCKEIIDGHRVIETGGLRFLILVCGENNILTNIQSKKNRVAMRYPNKLSAKELKSLNYDIVFNPGHTEMGNQCKMQERWKWLSDKNRYCIHCSNVLGERRGGSFLYVFNNGKKMYPENDCKKMDKQPYIKYLEIKI